MEARVVGATVFAGEARVRVPAAELGATMPAAVIRAARESRPSSITP